MIPCSRRQATLYLVLTCISSLIAPILTVLSLFYVKGKNTESCIWSIFQMNAMFADQHCLLDQVFSLASLTWSLSKLVNGNVWLSIVAITLHDHIILHLNIHLSFTCTKAMLRRESKVEISFVEGWGLFHLCKLVVLQSILSHNCFSVIVCRHHVNIWLSTFVILNNIYLTGWVERVW